MASARPQPNYDQPPQDLYTAISRQHLSSQKSLLALSLSSHANTYPSTPSWAIDWTVLQSDSLKFNYQLWLKINPLFRADRALETKQPYFNHANTTLFLKGYLVDEVVTAIQFGSVSSVNDHIADIMSKLEPGGPYPGKEQTTWADAWFRTIIADSVRCPEVRNLSSPQAALHRMSDDEHEEGFKLRGKFILQTQNPWLPKVDRKEFAPGESNEGKGLWGKYLWYETIPPHAPDQNRLANFARAIRAQAQHITYHRTFFLTRNGYIGIANKCKPSDEIYIASCGNMPIVLEKVVGAFKERWNAVEQTGSDKIIENHHFRVVGDCYLHGFMDGEHNERLLRECGRLSLLAIV
jgi:hypothetical protein